MAAVQEVVFTSCLGDPAVSAYVWDMQTGTSLTTYRGSSPVPPAGLSLLSAQYVVAALQDKPFLCVWPVNSQQPLSTPRLLCPGRVSHAQASPDGCHIAVTVMEKLHVYQVGSGRQLWTGVRHFQPVRVVRWTRDGGLVVCGGEDGLVTVWPLAAPQGEPQPRHTLAHHTLPVTDLCVTAGQRPRLLSVSADCTCKIYDLWPGSLLVSLVFDSVLTAVTTSPLETDVFVGTDSGAIAQFSLLSPPRQLEYHLTAAESAPVFTGHTKAVRCLAVSADGHQLLSGSADGSVKLWHVSSHQCLRTIAHKGSVTNAFFATRPKQLFDNELKPTVVLNAFQTTNEDVNCVEVITERSLSLCDNSEREPLPTRTNDSSEDRVKSLQMEIDLLRSINNNLYKFSVDKIIAGNTVVPRVPQVATPQVKKRKRKGNTFVKGPVDGKKTKPNDVAAPVRSLSKNNKRKRKKNKNKTSKTS